jgi:hypothetical protein
MYVVAHFGENIGVIIGVIERFGCFYLMLICNISLFNIDK